MVILMTFIEIAQWKGAFSQIVNASYLDVNANHGSSIRKLKNPKQKYYALGIHIYFYMDIWVIIDLILVDQ